MLMMMKSTKMGKRGSVEIYSPERKAEFILSNAVDKDDYKAAKRKVREMGLNPKNIPNRKPKKLPES